MPTAAPCQLWQPKMSLDTAQCPLGLKLLPIENHCSGVWLCPLNLLKTGSWMNLNHTQIQFLCLFCSLLRLLSRCETLPRRHTESVISFHDASDHWHPVPKGAEGVDIPVLSSPCHWFMGIFVWREACLSYNSVAIMACVGKVWDFHCPGFSIVLGCLSPLASLYHSYHLDIPVSAFQFRSVQSLSRVRLFVTPRTTVHQASLSISNSRSLLKLMFIELVMPTTQLLRPNLSNESGPRVTPGLACKISWCHCDARAPCQTHHVGRDHWSRLVPMSSLSFCISMPRFEPRSQVPWKEHRLGSETNLDPNSNYEKLLLGDSSGSSKFRGFGVLLVKIETVSSQGPVFKDQVIWSSAHERHVQNTCMVFFPVKKGSSKDFSSTPVVKTAKAGGTDLIPGRGTKIPHASWCGQKKCKKKKILKSTSCLGSSRLGHAYYMCPCVPSHLTPLQRSYPVWQGREGGLQQLSGLPKSSSRHGWLSTKFRPP